MRIRIAGFMFVVALLITMALPLFAGSATVYAHGGDDRHTSCAGGAPAAVANSGGAFITGPGEGPEGNPQISGLATLGPRGLSGILVIAHGLVCDFTGS